MKKVRLGVIGTGEFAEACHLPGIKSDPRAELVAVCGRNFEKAEAVARRFSIPYVYTDYDEMCRRDDLDGITVVTPNAYHAAQAISALAHGKHVLCEKPLGMNVAEAWSMAQVAESSGKVHQVAFTFRYGYALRELRRRVQAGDIGKPFYVRVQYDSWDGLRPGWQAGWRERQEMAGGGLLYDLGSHLFDAVRFVLGPIDSVNGFVHRIPRPCVDRVSGGGMVVETDDLASATFALRIGGRGQLFISRITPRFTDNGYLEVIGPEAALKASLSRGKIDLLKISRPSKAEWEELPLTAAARDGQPHSLGRMMRSFVDACLRGDIDEEFDASFHDGLAVQEHIQSVIRSGWSMNRTPYALESPERDLAGC
jgi:predicted dehydrogenase